PAAMNCRRSTLLVMVVVLRGCCFFSFTRACLRPRGQCPGSKSPRGFDAHSAVHRAPSLRGPGFALSGYAGARLRDDLSAVARRAKAEAIQLRAKRAKQK